MGRSSFTTNFVIGLLVLSLVFTTSNSLVAFELTADEGNYVLLHSTIENYRYGNFMFKKVAIRRFPLPL